MPGSRKARPSRPEANLRKQDAGAEVKLSVENGRLEVSRQGKPKYRLAELLHASRGKKPRLTAEDRLWLNEGPVGKELI